MQRDARYEAIVQMLLDRQVEDRDAREKRQLRYRQHLENDAGPLGSAASTPDAHTRLHKFPTKVPCRVTPEARVLLGRLKKQFSGSTVAFIPDSGRHQVVLLTGESGAEPMQIGWFEQCVQTDPKFYNVRYQGLSVETNGSSMLVLRFRYPATAVRTHSRDNAVDGTPRNESELCDTTDEMASVDFTEIRAALEPGPSDEIASPSLVWVTRPEVETMDALGSREYEAFYVRFKLEVQAGIWNALTRLLSRSGAQLHRGSYYTVVQEPDITNGRIHQKTVDDRGNAVNIGWHRTYDATAATDIVLLYLGGDILADFADIYFTLRSLSAADAYLLKEEFFQEVRHYWANTPSLATCYGSEFATVVRMAQRAVPTPAQALLLKEDWTSLRQSLIDRYGEGGRSAAELVASDVDRPSNGPVAWPFVSFPPGEVNVGLRLIYRQECRRAAVHGGVNDEQSNTTSKLSDAVDEAASATVEAMKWHLEVEGSINTGFRGLASRTNMGLERECRESSRDISTRLSDIMRKMGLQNHCEVLTRPAEIQNVVLVAERLPTPAEIDVSWVKRHDWMLAKVLLDESFREALNSISRETRLPDSSAHTADPVAAQDEAMESPDALYCTTSVCVDGTDVDGEWKRGYRVTGERPERFQRDVELETQRERLCEHLRANILHYQRAIWQQEDPQQRSMRYRKAGKKVPLEWRFELESGCTLTIDELSNRLTAPNVDGQFAAYSGGREAHLDQVIDPAGPIGYYGNYAIYHMRPEFGSEEMFSMLHFFKSPYLRPNSETGEPEVADPVQIQLSESPAVVAAGGRAMGHFTDDILRYVTELRQKLDCCEAPEGHELTLQNGSASALLSAGDQRAREAEWLILSGGADRRPALLASAGAVFAHGAEVESVIAARGEIQNFTLVADATRHDEPVIRASGEGERMAGLHAGAAGVSIHANVIVAHDDAKLVVGTGVATVERVIVAKGDGVRTPSLVADAGVVRAHDPEPVRLIFARDNAVLRPSLIAG